MADKTLEHCATSDGDMVEPLAGGGIFLPPPAPLPLPAVALPAGGGPEDSEMLNLSFGFDTLAAGLVLSTSEGTSFPRDDDPTEPVALPPNFSFSFGFAWLDFLDYQQ